MIVCNHCVYVLTFSALSLIIATSSHADIARERIVLTLNQVSEIQLPRGTTSVALGSSDLVDIVTQKDDRLIITGKRIGETNLLVRNQEQVTILELLLTVEPRLPNMIAIYRGNTAHVYTCEPICKPLDAAQSTQRDTQEAAPRDAGTVPK